MSQMPRVAVGTIQQRVDRRPLVWALYSLLEQAGMRVQAFLPESRLPANDAAAAITGQPYRHLDPWLMSRGSCREFFWHGSRLCDLAVVEGHYDDDSLTWLAETLDAPRLVVVDVQGCDDCRLPRRPATVDGVLLDGAAPDSISRYQTLLESLWGVPVIGAMSPANELRRAIGRLAVGEAPSAKLCQALAGAFVLLRPERLLAMAAERRLPPFETRLFREGDELDGLNAAVACDAAFPTTFPETLELMELHGASVRDFSPLADDGLPEETNLVMLGPGRVERFARDLAANHCLKHSLLAYVRQGGRIYAEGGGLAWLGRQLVLCDGDSFPMAGVLPTIAFHQSPPCEPPRTAAESRVELTLSGHGWLGDEGVRLRGYLNASWRVGAIGSLQGLSREPERAGDLFSCGQVVGSRLNIDFAAQQEFLERLFRPSVEAGLPCRV